jgi:hypothetical protein
MRYSSTYERHVCPLTAERRPEGVSHKITCPARVIPLYCQSCIFFSTDSFESILITAISMYLNMGNFRQDRNLNKPVL